MTTWFYTNIPDSRGHSTKNWGSTPTYSDNSIPGRYTPQFDVTVDYHLSEHGHLPWSPARDRVRAGDGIYVYRRFLKKHRAHAHDGALVAWGSIESDPHYVISAAAEYERRNVVQANLIFLPPELAIPHGDLMAGPLESLACLSRNKFAPPAELSEEQVAWLRDRTETRPRL